MKVIENKTYIRILPEIDYADAPTLYHLSRAKSASINLVYKVDVSGDKKLIKDSISLHSVNDREQTDVFEVCDLTDGLYRILSLIVPLRSFLEQELGMVNGFTDYEYQRNWKVKNPKNALKPDTRIIIAADPDSPTQLSFLQGQILEDRIKYTWVCIDDLYDLLETLNNKEIEDNFVTNTNIQVECGQYLRYLDLKDRWYKLAQDYFTKYHDNACSKNQCGIKLSRSEIEMRDYLWMVLHAIKYALEQSDYFTALKLLTCTQSCNNNESVSGSTKCGCS